MIDRSQQRVTVFGGGGFIGRYVCEALLARGVRLLVASRSPEKAHFIQPLGRVGQTGRMRANVMKIADVRRAVEGADAVVNLVGSFDHMMAINGSAAGTIAEAARDAGARALVHVSAIGADPDSPSAYGQSKAEGEQRVRAAFPSATVLRPSLVFGPEDALTNRFAGLGAFPVFPVLAPATRFQPVYVEDLAKAVAAAATDPARHGGKTYAIAGPEVMTMRAMVEKIMALSGRSPQLVDLPDFASAALSKLGFLPGAPITQDQWLMLQRDNVATPDLAGLDAFGIDPVPMAAVAGAWLGRYRRGGRFAMQSPDTTDSA